MNTVSDLRAFAIVNERTDEADDPRLGGRRKPIGAILVDEGLIALDDVERILSYGQKVGARFGEAAVRLGMISPQLLDEVLAFQFDHAVIDPQQTGISPEVAAAWETGVVEQQDFRALRNQICLRWLDGDMPRQRCVALLSLDRHEGRSFAAANLAVTFSRMGQRTLLIDADMRHPRQHLLFGIRDIDGLSGHLAGRGEAVAQRIAQLPALSVLPCGGVPPNPGDLLTRPALAALLARFEEQYDVVLLDTPAAAGSPEAMMLAARAKGCVLLARHHASRYNGLHDLAAELGALGSTVIGTVLMQF